MASSSGVEGEDTSTGAASGPREELSVGDEVAALRRELGEIQKVAERERGLLEAVLLQSPYGIIVSDAKGRLIVENRASQRIWAGTAPTGSDGAVSGAAGLAALSGTA